MSKQARIVVGALSAVAAVTLWIIFARVTDPQTVGNLAEWVAAVGTVSALVYAARQLRNETSAIRASDEQRKTEADDARHQLVLLKEQANIARDALVASTRPLLVGGDLPVTVDLNAGSCSVDLRNIGTGPAFLLGVGTPLLEGYAGSGSYTSGVVAVGELVRITVVASPDVPELEPLRQSWRAGGPTAVVDYNGPGGQSMTSEVHVYKFDSEWRIRQVFIRDDGGFSMTSGPATP